MYQKWLPKWLSNWLPNPKNGCFFDKIKCTKYVRSLSLTRWNIAPINRHLSGVLPEIKQRSKSPQPAGVNKPYSHVCARLRTTVRHADNGRYRAQKRRKSYDRASLFNYLESEVKTVASKVKP